ncbi:MAG: hypothetical protein HAW59_05630 [Betaproteobacteria bacterium]|nr:hypothetical protein [Betaproteobacteria bacterium]
MLKHPKTFRFYLAAFFLAAALSGQHAAAYGVVWRYGGKTASATGVKTDIDSRKSAVQLGRLACQAERRRNRHSRYISCRMQTFANQCAAVYVAPVVGGAFQGQESVLAVLLLAYSDEGDWTAQGKEVAEKRLLKKCADLPVPPSAIKSCPRISEIAAECDITPDCPGMSHGEGNERCEKETQEVGELTESETAVEDAVAEAQTRATDAAANAAVDKVAAGASVGAAMDAARTAAEKAIYDVAAKSDGDARWRVSKEKRNFLNLAKEVARKVAESAESAISSSSTKDEVRAAVRAAAEEEKGIIRDAMITASARAALAAKLPASKHPKAFSFEPNAEFGSNEGAEDYTYGTRVDYTKGKFTAFAEFDKSRYDENYTYGTRLDFGENEITAYWALNQSRYNGATDALEYLMGARYEKEFVSAEVDGTSYEGVLDMAFAFSGEWEKGILRYGSGVNYDWTNEYGEDAEAHWDTEATVSYKRWEINPSFNVYWASEVPLGKSLEFAIELRREF